VLPVTVGESVDQPSDVPVRKNLLQSRVFTAAIGSLKVITTLSWPGVEPGAKDELNTVGAVLSIVFVAEEIVPTATRSPAKTEVAETERAMVPELAFG
jgi:hypothetical protein